MFLDDSSLSLKMTKVRTWGHSNADPHQPVQRMPTPRIFRSPPVLVSNVDQSASHWPSVASGTFQTGIPYSPICCGPPTEGHAQFIAHNTLQRDAMPFALLTALALAASTWTLTRTTVLDFSLGASSSSTRR